MRDRGFVADDMPGFVRLHALFAPRDLPPLPPSVPPTVAPFAEALRFALTTAPCLVVASLLMVSLERHTSQADLLRVLAERSVDHPLNVALLLHCWWRDGPPVEADEPQRLFEELRERLERQHAGSALELLMRDCRDEENGVAGAGGGAAEAAQATPPVRESPQPQSRLWQLMHPHALAAQLTALDEEFTAGLTASDIMAGRTQSAAGRAYEAWLQRCPLWVASEIVSASDADRPRALVFFLKVVVQLREIRNMSSFALLMEGLRHEAVQRLTLSWEPVLEVHAEAWEDLVRDTLPARLHAPRRGPTVPFAGALQRQVFQILFETQLAGAADVAVGDGAVDWAAEARIQAACRVWLRVRRRRQFVYGIVPHTATLEHLRRGASVLGAGRLGIVSRQAQPENQTLSDAVRSAGGLVSGFSSWFKNSPAAEEAKRSLPDAMCLPGAEWSEIFARGETLKFTQRSVVLEAGALNTHLWRVKRGALSAMSADGFIVGTLGEGQVFGELATVRPLGLRASVALVAVAPTCEVQRVSFVAFATVLKAQIELRVSFYRALSQGVSSRRSDLDLSTVGVPLAFEAPAEKPDATAKFFERFDMKDQEVLATFECSWEASCRLVACGKLYVTRQVVAVLGRAWSSTFRWVAPLAELSLFPEAQTLRIVSGSRSMLLHVEAPEKVVLTVPTATLPAAAAVPAAQDNRSWDFLVVSGMRSAVLRQGEALASGAGEVCWVARGQCVCPETGQLVPRNSSCFEGSFFALQPPPRRVVVLSETAHVLSVSWTFLNLLSATRPDVASNFFRLTGATLAERLLALDPLAATALALTKP